MYGIAGAMGVLIPIVGTIMVFTFLSVISWAGSRRREREAYYSYEFRKRLVEAGKMDAADVRELLKYEALTEEFRRRQGMLAGGLIVAGTGAGMLLGLRFIDDEAIWMIGYIPLFVGLGMLAYALLFSNVRKPEPPSEGH